MKYFIYDPQDTTYFYDTKEDFEKAISDFDFLGKYCDDGWSKEVENVMAGKLDDGVSYDEDTEDEYDFYYSNATYFATKTNVRSRPNDVDENGYSPSSDDWWGVGFDYICDYEFKEPNNDKR